MEISNLLNETITIEDQIGSEPYWFKVKKYGLTANFKKNLLETSHTPESYAKAIAAVVPEWDLTLDGEPFPPTVENLRNVPFEFLDRMLEKIAEVWAADEQ